jgi:hypothetical protein
VPTARSNDQGYGYVNAGGARALLDGRIPRLPADRGPGRRSVEENLEHGADVNVISHRASRRAAQPASRRAARVLRGDRSAHAPTRRQGAQHRAVAAG